MDHYRAMTFDRDALVTSILDVLASASKGRGPLPHYLTAYQIFHRLPDALRDALVAEYGEPGRGAGKHFTAVSRIAQVARDVAEYDFLDSQGLTFETDLPEDAASGAPVVGIYRMRRDG
jgi:hypothetical protein